MAKHLATGLAEASLFLHVQHQKQKENKRLMEDAEPIAIEQLKAEGKPLTVRNILERQWKIVERK